MSQAAAVSCVPENDAFRVITDVEEFLRLSLAHDAPYDVTVMGRALRVHPQTMSPKYSYSPQFVIRHWDVAPGMSVLDVGTGSGILALFAALAGAAPVVALDLNPHAVATARENAARHGLAIDVRHSDLFSAVRGERFDRVVFNAPYFNRKADPAVPLTYGVFDEDYRASTGFLNQARDHLTPDGRILLGFAALDDVALMHRRIDEAGLVIERECRETRGHTRLLYTLRPA